MSAQRPAALAVLLAVLALSACLAPGAPDPTGTAPIGNLERVTAEGDGIRLQGWVADPDTPDPIMISVSSEQKLRRAVADRPRPDVAAAYPRLGPNHGFDFRYPGVAPGRRQVCIWADNVGRGTEGRLLGCQYVQVGSPEPVGNLQFVDAPGVGQARAYGWAFDPDVATPVDVAFTVDGQFLARRPADQSRPDVGAFVGRPATLGFSYLFPLGAGRHTVCATVINQGSGSNRAIGCGVVDVPAASPDRRPTGRVTRVVPITGGVRISGTAADPDGNPTQALVAVAGGATTTIAVAGGAFQTDITGLPAGPVRLCVTLVDVASPPGVVATTGDRVLPCSSAVVGGAIGVGTSGSPTSVTPVGPAPSSPLAGIDRDAGISVRLRDGSVLWLFGDSSAVDTNGDVRYFVNNTAAWAAPGALTTTRDAAPGGLPVQFATPTGAFPACPPEAPVKAMWPMSAVAEPQGARDRVVVLMYNVCLGGPTTFAPRGVSVVEWYYDQATPPDGTPIRGTVLNQVLFNENEPTWGTAATIGGDGLLYTYSCAGPVRGGWPDEYGPCKVARVAPGSVATRSAWTYWAGGSTWSANSAAAVALTLPDGVDGKRVPVASMTVTRDPVQDVYVMVYSPWPGYTDRVQVRVATGPTGPWTAPVEVVLPGCEDTVAGVDFHCYAGTAQPSLSEPGLLGLGYYDQLVSVGPSRGQYITVKVPFTVVLTP